MTINFTQQILCRLNKAQELHKTTPIHLSAFIPWSCIESYPCLLESLLYCPAFYILTQHFSFDFPCCSISRLQTSHALFKPNSVILLMYAFNLRFWKFREAGDRKIWENSVHLFGGKNMARRNQLGVWEICPFKPKGNHKRMNIPEHQRCRSTATCLQTSWILWIFVI